MKAKELSCKDLMVGDWVTGKKWRENPFKLTRINDNGKYYYGITSDGTQVGPFLLEEIEPIPLTPEILEKNGFEFFIDTWYLQTEERKPIHIRFMDGFIAISINCNIIPMRLKYVHQLQHALRNCEIEKEIVL